jgi:predicted MFS family arabinose efflux permease
MSPRLFLTGCFALEALNALGTTWYFFYIYFFTEAKFGFGKPQNLALAAGLGSAYAAASWLGGKFAQRRGYFTALHIGCAVMAASVTVGSMVTSLGAHLAVMFTGIAGMALTWPALQALVSEGQPRARLMTMLGIYNLVWSGFGAVAYSTGGAMIESWGPRAQFLVPAALFTAQVALVLWLKRGSPRTCSGETVEACGAKPAKFFPASSVAPKTFLRMAWVANPFAYLAINTVVAMGPSIAKALELSPRYAGYYCSIWMFVRSVAFGLFWFWPGWHYRFRWLVAAYVGMIGAFAIVLLASSVAVLVAAQVGFGLCIGLIYYSSLFYSMDVGETKGEHGGIHEAVIGLGSAAGPAVGAAGLWLAPAAPHASVWAVGVLLFGGLGLLLWVRQNGRGRERRLESAPSAQA